MSKLIKTDGAYSRWIQELKERYRCSQIKAATQVNREMLRFYWSLAVTSWLAMPRMFMGADSIEISVRI